MATSTNLGNQKITFDFKNPAKGSDFNRLLFGGIKPGVYRGLELSVTSSNSIVLFPGLAFLNCSFQTETKRMIASEFRNNIDFTFSNTSQNQLVYLRYDYKEIIENWVEINTATSLNNVPINSVIIGNVYFSGGNIVSADYKNKTWGFFRTDDSQYSINDIITFSDVGDKSKQIRFSASGVSSSSVRTVTIPDYDYSLNSIQNWNSSKNYKIGEIVLYNSVLYRCLFDHTSSNFVSQKSLWENVAGGASFETTQTLSYSSWVTPNQDLEISINHNLDRQIQAYVYNSNGSEEYFTGVYRVDNDNVKLLFNWEIREVLFPLGNSSPPIGIKILCV